MLAPRKRLVQPFPAAIEREYVAQLRRLVREAVTAIVAALADVLTQAQAMRGRTMDDDQPRTGWAGRIEAALILAGVTVEDVMGRVSALVTRFGVRISDFHRRGWQNLLRRGLGVQVWQAETWLPEDLSAWEAQNVALIRSIPEAAKVQLTGLFQRAVREARSLRDMRDEIAKVYRLSEARAELVARDQVGKLNGQLTEMRQREVGVTSYVWQSMHDSRVREAHRDRDGHVYQWAKPPSDGHPGQPVRCFPGSTKVDGFPRLKKLYRRRYAGELTEIVCADGVVLSATPNHPIMTPDGFVAAGLINAGTDVVRRPGYVGGVVNDDAQRLVPTFDQIAHALSLAGVGGVVTRGSRGQFHGDGTDGEVDVVSTDCLLVDEVESSVRKQLKKLGFSDADVVLVHALLTGQSSFFKNRLGNNDPRGDEVRRAGLMLSLLRMHLSPLQFLSFGLASDLYAGIDQMSPNDGASNVEGLRNRVFALSAFIHGDDAIRVQIDSIERGSLALGGVYPDGAKLLADDIRPEANDLRDFFKGFPGSVECNRVIEVRRKEFLGHVFNLETASGNYSAESVLVSNCRCFASPIIPGLEDLQGLTFKP